jgi:hypothetical protein
MVKRSPVPYGAFYCSIQSYFYYTFVDDLIAFSIFKKLFSEENTKDLVLFMKTETFNTITIFCFKPFS